MAPPPAIHVGRGRVLQQGQHIVQTVVFREYGMQGKVDGCNVQTACSISCRRDSVQEDVMDGAASLAGTDKDAVFAIICENTVHDDDMFDNTVFKAIAIWQPIVDDSADLSKFAALGHAYHRLGELNWEVAKADTSASFLKQAVVFYERLVEQHPDVARYRTHLADSCFDLSRYYSSQNDSTLEIALLENARKHLQSFDDPEMDIVRRNLAVTIDREASARNRHAWRLATSPDDKVRNGERAISEAQRACELSKQLTGVIRGPYLDTLAAAYAEEARFDEATVTQEKVLEASPKDLWCELEYRLDRYQRKRAYREPANDEERARQLEAIVEFGQSESRDHADPLYQFGLSRIHRELGDLKLRMNRVDEAANEYRQAVEILQRLTEQDRFHVGLADGRIGLATALGAANEFAQALDLLQTARRDLEKMPRGNSDTDQLLTVIAKRESELIARMQQPADKDQ